MEINGDYCYSCKKVWVQYEKIIHFLNLNNEVFHEFSPTVCSGCKRKMKKKELRLYYEWLGFKWCEMMKK